MSHFGNPAVPAPSSGEAKYYEQLFRSFDAQNFGTVQGAHVFGFFLSSGLTKAALGDIWDEATQKQSGGLSVAKFINAMKLIALAQRGIPPKLANISQNPMIGMPSMQYPSHIAKPSSTQSPPNQAQQNQTQQAQPELDPFGGLTSALGFGDIDDAVQTKPTAPNWTEDVMDKTEASIDKTEAATEDIIDNHNHNHNHITSPPIDLNEYGPSSHIKQHHAPTLTVDQHQMEDITPGLNRRRSAKILYQEERLREQIRQAEQREKLAKKQANTQRIENERLERENEQIRLEINGARQMQADALRQSQEALTSIQPLRVENEKLKQAINQWKELIQTKDEELEALEAEVDQLRLENEKLENVLRDDKSRVDDIQFKLERSDALLADIRTKNKGHETQIHELLRDNVTLEDDKRNLELKVAQIKDEMKKLKRNQNSGLGLDRNTLKQKEADLFNINNISFNSNANPNANASPPKSEDPQPQPHPHPHPQPHPQPQPQSQPQSQPQPQPQHHDDVDDDETAAIPPGTHDFNFSEDDGNNENANETETESDAYDDDEPQMIDKEITEQVEVFEDVVSTVLFDEEYRESPWYMSSSDVSNYHKYFIQADANKDGVIDGNEANKFFTKSKLNRKLLAKIWVLADQQKEGKLSEPMFCAMFQLVMKVKKSGNKLNVPNELPLCLTREVVEKLGTTVQKTVKQKNIITQKRIIQIENPNKKRKSKQKPKTKTKAKAKAKAKAKPKPKPKAKAKAKPKPKFDDNWGNDFSFDAKPNEAELTEKEKEKDTVNANHDTAAAADDNWNAFGDFFTQ